MRLKLLCARTHCRKPSGGGQNSWLLDEELEDVLETYALYVYKIVVSNVKVSRRHDVTG